MRAHNGFHLFSITVPIPTIFFFADRHRHIGAKLSSSIFLLSFLSELHQLRHTEISSLLLNNDISKLWVINSKLTLIKSTNNEKCVELPHSKQTKPEKTIHFMQNVSLLLFLSLFYSETHIKIQYTSSLRHMEHEKRILPLLDFLLLSILFVRANARA